MNLNANGRMKVLMDSLFGGRQEAFAHAIDVNPGTVSRWITGKTKIHRYTLIKVAEALQGKVNAHWLLEGTGDPGIKSTYLPMLSEENPPIYGIRAVPEKPDTEQEKIEEAAKEFNSLKEATNQADKKTSETYRKFGQLLKQVFEIGKEIGYFTE